MKPKVYKTYIVGAASAAKRYSKNASRLKPLPQQVAWVEPAKPGEISAINSRVSQAQPRLLNLMIDMMSRS